MLGWVGKVAVERQGREGVLEAVKAGQVEKDPREESARLAGLILLFVVQLKVL